MYFESFGTGPDKLIVSVRFSFLLKGKGLFMWLLFNSLLLSIVFDPM